MAELKHPDSLMEIIQGSDDFDMLEPGALEGFKNRVVTQRPASNQGLLPGQVSQLAVDLAMKNCTTAEAMTIYSITGSQLRHIIQNDEFFRQTYSHIVNEVKRAPDVQGLIGLQARLMVQALTPQMYNMCVDPLTSDSVRHRLFSEFINLGGMSSKGQSASNQNNTAVNVSFSIDPRLTRVVSSVQPQGRIISE